ncbi:MAG: hypothetical protein JST50_05100 [Bacteroidetes bacterium]|jgi:hypothetical protein|nr:hypothetical protein [Bacteroidota bacterium]
MAITLFKHKKHKIGLIILLVLIGIVLILAFIVNQYWSPILAKRVKSVVYTSSGGLYTIDFSDAKLHILRGELDIYNITLKPNTAVYNQRLKAHLAPNNLVELHVKRLIIYHMHPFMLYFQHRLEVGRIVLSQPELNVSYQQNHLKDTVTKDHRSIYQKISGSLKSIHIGDIILGDVRLKYQDYSGNKLAISELKEMNLSATDLLIDSASQTDKSRVMYCRDIVAELNNYAGQSRNGLYKYKIKSLRLSTKTSRLDIQGLDLNPVRPDVFFKNSERDRFYVHLDTLRIDNFDYKGYHKYRVINASHMTLSGGVLNLSGNPKFTQRTTDRTHTYPNFGLKEIRTDINIDTIDEKNINISYTEFNHKSDQTGTITFNNTSGRVLNVTTNKEALAKNNICTINLTSYFMNRGKLDAQFTFNLTDESLPYTYKGSIGPMDLTVLNPAVMTLGLIKVNTGQLTRFDFDIQADNSVSKGKVALLYNNLKLTVLKADTINDKLKHMTIASLFANVMVLKHNNPDSPGEIPRSFYVIYERPRDYPFFKNIWHTLLTGIKPCVGLDEKVQQDVKNKIADMAIKKQERQIKKEQRKQRRAERKLKRELKKQQKEQAELNQG